MSSIDKLALTCRLLYDQRVLEQRKEIEKLKVKLFFRDYTHEILENALKDLNYANDIKCKCRDCKKSGRICNSDTVDKEATCTLVPWFENVLHERGLVDLRRKGNGIFDVEWCGGPYNDEYGKISDNFVNFPFINDHCHLAERPGNHEVPWGEIYIGKRLWNVESIDNPCIRQFERVFGDSFERLSSPPTPPPSPKMAPLSTRPQPLPITTTINQGLELQALKKQLATQGLDMQTLREQLATQAAEMHELKEQLERIHHDADYKST